MGYGGDDFGQDYLVAKGLVGGEMMWV